MSYSRRTVIAAGTAGLAALAVGPKAKLTDPALDEIVAELAGKSEQANAALMAGDVDTYLSLITLSDDFILMSPFGGKPSRGAYSRAKWDEIGSFFKNGTLTQELVQAYGSAEMVVLVVIEKGRGEVGGLPAQEWPLRVTLVYQREGADWKLAHRHADPLAKGISLSLSAQLARGGAP